MQICVTNLDSSVTDLSPDLRRYRLKIHPLSRFKGSLSYASAELYSQITYQLENLADWVEVQAPISLIAQLQVAGLVDVRVEG